MAKVSLSGDFKPIEIILDWYSDQFTAIRELRNKVVANIIRIKHSSDSYESKFENFSLDEINNYYDSNEIELEHLTCFDLISATEGFLRNDFFYRSYKKDKTAIGLKFRSLYKDYGNKISLEDIIGNWKEETSGKSFSEFIGLLKYRHWLAHGRYWTPKFGRRYSVDSTYEIVNKICLAVQNYK